MRKPQGDIRRFQRERRRARIRRKVQGTAERPRLAVCRTLRHLYIQVIDDQAARTLASISTLDRAARTKLAEASNRMDRSRLLGRLLAERARERGVEAVAFDRGGSLYHGHVKAVAEGAREGGLQF